ncbi:MAG: hypothetical protein A3G10_02380 [Candidatus Wildermuthbacteria bacterium RIFCSPLOWO2_12_FULL_49_9]|nr:MAG: hypothetical protein A3G10_02380 [Candidatus Wildermuthbacteria bacterium RIFCSPLOWO2_12_FULL_49_9]
MKKILLVEDDPLLVDIYTTKLRQSGFEGQVAEQGEKALAAIEEGKPDLVLLDIVLPSMDGWDILRQVREIEKFRGIPIIILSNLGQKEEIEKGLRLGASKYLIKAHYTPSQIAEEVVKLIGTV